MIYTITGSNDFLRTQKLHSLVSSYKKEYGTHELEYIIANEVDIASILQRIQALPFLSAKKCIVVHDLSAHKNDLDAIQAAFLLVSDATELILYEPQLDKRTRYATALKKATTYLDFKPLDEAQLLRWLVETASNEGGELSRRNAEVIVKRVGLNQFQLYNELLKLLTRAQDITLESIEEMVDPTPQSSVFSLLDAVSEGNVPQALTILDEQKQQKAEPHMILGLIIGHITTLATIREAPRSARPEEIAKQAGVHPFVVKKNMHYARAYSREDIQAIIGTLHMIDEGYKHTSIDVYKALQYLIVYMANMQRTRA